MRVKKLLSSVALGVAVISLGACAPKAKPNPKVQDKDLSSKTWKEDKPKQDPEVRLKFNAIKAASAKDDFKGGTKLADIKKMYGEPKKHDTKPAGDVALDVYTWEVDGATIIVQMFEDSTIARSISNFAFVREQFITEKDLKEIKEGMTFQEATEKLGMSDIMGEAISSDGERLQAVWASNLKTENPGSQVELIFENDKLTEKNVTNFQ